MCMGGGARVGGGGGAWVGGGVGRGGGGGGGGVGGVWVGELVRPHSHDTRLLPSNVMEY